MSTKPVCVFWLLHSVRTITRVSCVDHCWSFLQEGGQFQMKHTCPHSHSLPPHTGILFIETLRRFCYLQILTRWGYFVRMKSNGDSIIGIGRRNSDDGGSCKGKMGQSGGEVVYGPEAELLLVWQITDTESFADWHVPDHTSPSSLLLLPSHNLFVSPPLLVASP